ncbi:hypothetical protein [Beggiatoa leptomitoformis]|uniref:DUF3108 domain-containing protein n=1 Tax=Beggiatoa leptomitoformis TaxID=288004 RepID=A0A2N9YEL6_9GAMM|nr:hypothetical protein [Beggiatoa leptomitoformis]ALG68753.1 hypothetical protein AL038_14935 [Beggiatoa leptomitoformis]AUI68886.1 hypothetical protein BLE401_09325 [Beggiatoa leptomitoformis]
MRFFVLLISMCCGFSPIAHAETYSQANTLLFFTNHLQHTETPSSIAYTFSKKGTVEEGFTDTIQLKISQGTTGKNVHVDYFSQDRRQLFPDVNDAQGNPILLLFLQRSVQELQRLAPVGHWRYFQNQVKIALEESATVKEIQFNYHDKTLTGKEISFYPFKDNPKFTAYPDYQQTLYRLILSEQVTGGVYQLSWQVVGTASAPLLLETLTMD